MAGTRRARTKGRGALSPTAHPTRVLLVGFMGSGKSTTGRRLARLLDWAFTDMDEEVEREAGHSIPEIFEMHGEEAFRTLEAAAAARLLDREGAVIASGGGWPCAAGRLDDVPEGTLSVWLRVSAEEAVSRTRQRAELRPLLAVTDPLARARELLEAREPFYRSADWVVDTDDSTSESVAEEIARRLKEAG